MRIAAVNGVKGSSTGQIMNDLAIYMWKQGHEMYTFTPAEEGAVKILPWSFEIGTPASHQEHIEQGIRTGLNGCFEEDGTREMLRAFEELGIELVQLFNLHNFVLNLPMLFDWIRERHIPVVWTLHCCWPYTGKCIHYSMAKCDKWKTGCGECPLMERWPYSDVDNTAAMWQMKKQWFAGVDKMVVVSTAAWLERDVKQSFLGQYPGRLIYCGIHLNRFRPVAGNFREEYGLEGKTVLLGVADDWRRRKGLKTMITLAEKLDKSYQLVLVGTDEEVEEMLPPEIVSIRNTRDTARLAGIYSAADMFLQTTQEETFGLVNVEALACGTPVITFDTGGSAEIPDEYCGRVIPYGDVDAMIAAIHEQARTGAMTREACLERAKRFSVERMCEEYIALYHELETCREG
ncbi:MAG: glycosyltransferase [Clostridia bacterium]|nr:glycosyltransferase [Clostridia bacterium]